MTYDLIIIGGGPAGVAAGVYAARKKLQTLFFTYDFGGQSNVSAEIQNWIGTPAISGEQLAKNLEAHLRAYEGNPPAGGLIIKSGVKVAKVDSVGKHFTVSTDDGQTSESRTVLVTTGATRRKLMVSGADIFEQKGITYCATCDGPMFADKDVVVVGGGNAAFETALQLLAYAKSIIILHHGAEFKADKITVDKVLARPKIKAVLNAETIEIKGDKFVKSLVYKNKLTDEKVELITEGVFVEIGLVPTTALVQGITELNAYGSIVVDPKNQRTKTAGLWAAGDCTDGLYHQNNIATGDAIKALEDIYLYLYRQ